MSIYAFSVAMEIRKYEFYALLMAAMANADSENVVKLRNAFPEVWNELVARYNAPGGMLPEERPPPPPVRER